MSEEQWKPIPGFDGYEVSNLGRVMSHKGKQPRLLVGGDGGGYRQVLLYSYGQSRTRRHVHHLVLEAFVGPREPESVVRHLDGDASNNALANLAYGSRSDNMFDRVRHGTDRNAAKTECDNGHAFDEANTYWYGPGKRSRHCRVCLRSRDRAYRIRKALAAANVPTERAA